MNTFLEQFYDIPVDVNALYLKKILADEYSKFSNNFKSVKKLSYESAEVLKGGIFTDFKDRFYYLYELRDERFVFTLGKFNSGENFATVEYLEKNEIRYRQDKNLPYKIIYHENDNEYFVQFFLPNGKEITKQYVVLKYNRHERILLKKIVTLDPNNNGTDKESEIISSIYNKTFIWLNKNNQKHRSHEPAEVIYTKNMSQITHQFWYQRGKMHHPTEPAVLIYDLKKRLKKEAYFNLDRKHFLNGAAEIYYNYGENSVIRIWYENDELIKTDLRKINSEAPGNIETNKKA